MSIQKNVLGAVGTRDRSITQVSTDGNYVVIPWYASYSTADARELARLLLVAADIAEKPDSAGNI